VSTPTWSATASSSPTRPPSTASSTRSSNTTERIGCSGWNYRDWRGTFYPEGLPAGRWLEHYATVFDTVEVNNTFYRLTTARAVANWVRQTPPGFCFTVKASRYLTHVKRLDFEPVNCERFYAPLAPMIEAGKLGAVLWQLPPNFRRDDERLVRWLHALPEGRHALEVRHESWYDPEVFARLHEHDVALVAAWRKGLGLPRDVVTASFHFLRFHYGERGRRGNYSSTEIDELAAHIRTLDGPVFAYFNNDWEAFAPRNAVALSERIRTPAAG
jgi:uncharacterized protein YecE (DUF72 family)